MYTEGYFPGEGPNRLTEVWYLRSKGFLITRFCIHPVLDIIENTESEPSVCSNEDVIGEPCVHSG